MGTTCSIPGFGIARRLNIREFIGLLRVHLKATVQRETRNWSLLRRDALAAAPTRLDNSCR